MSATAVAPDIAAAVLRLGAPTPEPVELDPSWHPVALGAVIANGYEPKAPDVLRTADGATAFLYRGAVNGLHGDSGIGKSWVLFAAIAQALDTGHRAVLLDFESNAAEVVARLRSMAVRPERIVDGLTYIAPSETVSDQAIDAVLSTIQNDTAVIGIDSLGEAFGLDGIDENADSDVGPWLRRVARRLADAGPAVVIVDHATKANDNPLHPSGSKRKRAAITGASYLVKVIRPFTREQPGTLGLVCAKDRHGHHARGAEVATVDVNPYPDGGVVVKLHQATKAAPDSPGAIVETCARAAIRLVRDEGRPMSMNEVAQRVGVKASAQTKRAAIEFAIGRSALAERPGPRRARLISYVAELDEATSSHFVPTSSDVVPHPSP